MFGCTYLEKDASFINILCIIQHSASIANYESNLLTWNIYLNIINNLVQSIKNYLRRWSADCWLSVLISKVLNRNCDNFVLFLNSQLLNQTFSPSYKYFPIHIFSNYQYWFIDYVVQQYSFIFTKQNRNWHTTCDVN